MTPKVTTCCYCGSRAALVLGGDVRHELACGTCGAPLHDLRAIKVHTTTDGPAPKRAKGPAKPPPHRLDLQNELFGNLHMARSGKKKKKRKAKLKKKLISKAFDVIEDIFD